MGRVEAHEESGHGKHTGRSRRSRTGLREAEELEGVFLLGGFNVRTSVPSKLTFVFNQSEKTSTKHIFKTILN